LTSLRPVVTGIGLLSPLALNSKEHFDAWLAGEFAVRLATNPEFGDLGPQMEARVHGFDRAHVIGNRMLRKLLSPSAGFSVAAAGQAIRDAGLADDRAAVERCGLYVGSLSLEIAPNVFVPPLEASLRRSGEFDLSLFARRGMRVLDPLFLVRALPNAGACGISIEHQVLGPNTNLTNGATSGLMAVGLAMAAIQRGELQCALAGGYDTLLVMDAIAEHHIEGRLSRHHGSPRSACRPFDCRRDGYALGEGAAFVLLESQEHAHARGARVYAELLSFAATTKSALLHPDRAGDPTALLEAGRRALEIAKCRPEEVGVVFGDGLGTENDDLREAQAVHGLFSRAAVPFTAATSAIGYTGAVSGVFSLIHSLFAVERGVAPGLANCDDPDPRCPVHFLRRPEPMQSGRVVVWNSQRGVKNVAVVVGSVHR
jgi:3-oxoacyl-[acyl-carrier-protein] synthase II